MQEVKFACSKPYFLAAVSTSSLAVCISEHQVRSMTSMALARGHPTAASIARLTVGYLFGGFLAGVGLGAVIGTPHPGVVALARNVVAAIVAVACMTVAGAR